MRFSPKTFCAATLAASLMTASPAAAYHVLFLDFSEFTMAGWATVNGNTPPTANDLALVRSAIVASMVRDYATFDVRITTERPTSGRYTEVDFLDSNQGGLMGCAGPDCCVFGNCTGIGSFDEGVSACEVYTGSFAASSTWQDENATTARIASGLSSTASHEAGHVLGLGHCHSADDRFQKIELSCAEVLDEHEDGNINWHIMASGSSTGLPTSARAERDRFFSVHTARRLLVDDIQARSHWAPLADADGDGDGDLTYACVYSENSVQWFEKKSLGTGFTAGTKRVHDGAGKAGDVFLVGDVTGDGLEDLVYVERTDPIFAEIWVSDGASFSLDAIDGFSFGAEPTHVMLADMTGDGVADLVGGFTNTDTDVDWIVAAGLGAGCVALDCFGAPTAWSGATGNAGDQYRLADGDGDGRMDLFFGRPVGQISLTELPDHDLLRWSSAPSTGASLGAESFWASDAGGEGWLIP